MEQTAVEWLEDHLELVSSGHVKIEGIIKQAKEMEKQQIIDAAYFGHLKGWVDNGFENSYGEHYYNKTFKSK